MNQKQMKLHHKARLDGWNNIVTGLGVEGRDKRLGMQMRHNFFTQIQAELIYHGDDIAQKVIDKLPEDMLREGFEVTSDDVEGLSEDIESWMEELGLYSKLEEACKISRLHGGAGIVLGIDDGLSPDKPVNEKTIRTISFATVLSRYEFAAPSYQDLDRRVTSPNFGNPIFYKLAPVLAADQKTMMQSSEKIHYSRIIRFIGAPVRGQDRGLVNYWGDSILSKINNAITNYQSSEDSAALIMQDVTQLIVKLKGLSQLVSMGPSGDDLIRRRLNLLTKMSSILNAVVVEDGEDVEKKTTQLAGIPDLLRRIEARLCTAANMPHTILLGESPSGLGATGNSEKQDWFEYVRASQESQIRPPAKRLVTLRLLSKDGPTSGKMPEKFMIDFNPLWVPSEKEQVEVRKGQAEVDKIYTDIGATDANEIRNSRFGSGRYSTETTLDDAAHELAMADLEQQAKNAESQIQK